MSLFRTVESSIGMFQCLLGVLVSGLVVFFPVVYGGSTVRVCGKFVELGSSLVRVTWHCFFPSSAQSIKTELLVKLCPSACSRGAEERLFVLHRCTIVSGRSSNHSCSAGTPRNVFEFTWPEMFIQ